MTCATLYAPIDPQNAAGKPRWPRTFFACSPRTVQDQKSQLLVFVLPGTSTPWNDKPTSSWEGLRVTWLIS